jgi:hypothetical protein
MEEWLINDGSPLVQCFFVSGEFERFGKMKRKASAIQTQRLCFENKLALMREKKT